MRNKQEPRFPLLSTIAISIASGLLIGWPKAIPSRAIAGKPEKESSLQFATLPCPSEERYASLKKTYRIDSDPPEPEPRKSGTKNNLCGYSRRAKLAKFFHWMDRLRMNIPSDWKGGASEALRDPGAYLRKMTIGITYDFSSATQGMIAVNRMDIIFLSARFFELEPFEVLLTLIHEARHSEAQASRHDACPGNSDLPFIEGGCDRSFEISPRAGAYAFEASFAYGLLRFMEGLSPRDRDSLLNTALFTLLHRFRKLPPQLASPVDQVYLLDEKGVLSRLDPDRGTRIRLSHGLNSRPVRALTSSISFRLWIFTEDQRLYQWQEQEKPKRAFSKALGPEAKTLEISQSLRPDEWGHPSITFLHLDPEQVLSSFEVDPRTARQSFERIEPQPPRELKFRQLALGRKQNTFALSEEGDVWAFQWRKKQFVPSSFSLPKGFRQIHGGLLLDQLFGVGNDGKIYIFARPGKSMPSTFAPSGHVIRFQEGVSGRYALDREGNLHFQKYGEHRSSRFYRQREGEPQIVDFALIRGVKLSPTLSPGK